MERYLPDAFIFALLLTLLVFVWGVLATPTDPVDMLLFWGDGLDDLFQFAMEMVLILVGGFTLARTNLVSEGLKWLGEKARTPFRGVLMAVLVSSIACWINWGFGLVVAGIFAVELGRRVKGVNYALLVAMSYSGFLLWHGGLSGSIPLKLTSPSSEIMKILNHTSIGLEQTIFSSFNLILVFLHLVVLVILGWKLGKIEESSQVDLPESASLKPLSEPLTPAARLEQSKWLTRAFSLFGFGYLAIKIWQTRSLNLSLVILIFFFLGFFLYETPKKYLQSFAAAVKDSGGIILQFPLYAGIMAMMRGSGLADQLSAFFVSISDQNTFLLFTYWSAGLVNFFVPSGGGQWALQAPFILPAATELGVSHAKAAMAIAWGDAWSNMVQPFWALPLLSVAKIPLRHVMGYLVVIFISVGFLSSLYFLFLS